MDRLRSFGSYVESNLVPRFDVVARNVSTCTTSAAFTAEGNRCVLKSTKYPQNCGLNEVGSAFSTLVDMLSSSGNSVQ